MQHPSASPMTAYLNPQIRNSPVNSSLRLRPPALPLYPGVAVTAKPRAQALKGRTASGA